MLKGDTYHKIVLKKILEKGYKDENPRPHYEDNITNGKDWYKKGNNIIIKHLNGKEEEIVIEDNCWIITKNRADGYTDAYKCTPAHTISINHIMQQYDLSIGELPLESIRPIAWKSAVKEILWIYQMQSNKLSDLHDLGINYWDQWDIGDGTIGCRYGATVKKHNLINNLLEGLEKDPFGRRHIMSLWQIDDFKDETGGTTKGLNPCCYESIWNVRKENGIMYLDMLMNQRSSDYEVSCAINELQYIALQMMVAKHLGYTPGIFTHIIENCQIYDRHIDTIKELLKRDCINCNPKFILDTDKTNFFEFTIDDFKLVDYPNVKEINPQVKFDLGI